MITLRGEGDKREALCLACADLDHLESTVSGRDGGEHVTDSKMVGVESHRATLLMVTDRSRPARTLDSVGLEVV